MTSIVTKPDEQRGREDTKSKDKESVFVPWGLKAREILQSIVCGEIPLGYGYDRFDFGDTKAAHGAQIRCILCDLRTGEASASSQRAAGIMELEKESLAELERKAHALAKEQENQEHVYKKAENTQQQCTRELSTLRKLLEKAKSRTHEFKAKYGRYFNPGKSTMDAANLGISFNTRTTEALYRVSP